MFEKLPDLASSISTSFLNFQGLARYIIIVNVDPSSSCTKHVFITLQEMCCGFLLSREMWYRKSVLPGTGAG